MALLAGTLYDPGTLATLATTAAAPMTALDTTNLRLGFTVPANGIVAVKARVPVRGGSTSPSMHMGVLEGSTVKARHAGTNLRTTGNANSFGPAMLACVVTGLTPSASLNWDLAAGVETGIGSTQLSWGGPNNATANDARGGAAFEIWEAANLLGAVAYDPTSAVTSASTASTAAMTALDTTNLRVSFTTPASGQGSAKVLVRCRAVIHGTASGVTGMIGVLDGATVKARFGCTGLAQIGATAVTDFQPWDASGIVAVSPSTSYNWDLAYGVEGVQSSSALKYGGPDNSSADDAFGAAVLEVWKA